MRDFHDIRFEGKVGSDLECSVGFVTDVVRTKKGSEYRNARLGQPRHAFRWSVARASSELDSVRQFHAARKGSRYSFRFRDPSDCDLPLTVISTGSTGTDYDIVKRYTAGGTTFERRILLPDTSQTTVWVNSTKADSTAWSMTTDYRLRVSTALVGAGKPVAVEGVFDVPCRFDAALASRIASPEADEVTVELSEARYSPAVSFSTGSTWSPQTCNVLDSTDYFFDGFSGTALSTNWALQHIETTAGVYEWKAGSTGVNTTVSGGFFWSPASAGVASRYVGLSLQTRSLHPPFQVRGFVLMKPATDGVSLVMPHFKLDLTTSKSTGVTSTGAWVNFFWPTASTGYIYAGDSTGSTRMPHTIPVDSGAYHGSYFKGVFTTASAYMTIVQSTGGAYSVTYPTTALAGGSTYYLRVVNYAMHFCKLDWIEVVSL